MDYIHYYNSPMGRIMMASGGNALSGLWFEGQRHFAETLSENYEEKPVPVFAETDRWLDIYFSGKDPGFTPELNLRTTAFRKKVWEILLTIPFGKTLTYREIAVRIAGTEESGRMSARAVGGAVGHNAISLIVPCHRVVGADGSLTGYAGGIERKRMLLQMEQSARETDELKAGIAVSPRLLYD